MSNDEREHMTQEEWDETRRDLERFLQGVEDRHWDNMMLLLRPLPLPPQADIVKGSQEE